VILACLLLGIRAEDDGIMASPFRVGGISVDYKPMSPEEIERTVQFLLGQQGQFAADLATLSGKTDRIADAMIGLTGIVGRLADAQERTSEQLRETDQHLRETDQRLRETDARLSGHIERVESHLTVLIQVFEQHLREDHGHRPS
jgi:uncharacterized protein YukE